MPIEITVLKQNGVELTLERTIDNAIRIGLSDNEIGMSVDLTGAQVEDLKKALNII
jgi:hypothetical protein